MKPEDTIKPTETASSSQAESLPQAGLPGDSPAAAPKPTVTAPVSDVSAPSQAPVVSAPATSVSSPAPAAPDAAVPARSAVVTGGGAVNGGAPFGPNGSAAPHKKKWLLPAAVVAAVLLGGSGYVFGMYLPSQPEAIYKKGLSNSAAAVDKLVDMTNDYRQKNYQGAKFTGTATLKSASGSFDAKLDGQSYKNNAKLTANLNLMGKKLTTDALSVSSSDGTPDLYFKMGGIKSALGDDSQYQPIADLDGQWLSIDHTVIDTYLQAIEQNSSGESAIASLKSPTADQIDDAATKVQVVNKKYLFSSDTDTAVLTYKSFEGSEQKLGRKVNHYKAGYNKDHLKTYIDELGKALDASKLASWYKQQSGSSKSISEGLDTQTLQSDIADMKGTETFDVYVDVKTKLLQTVSFSGKDSDGKNSTVSISQNYTGGDEYPFQVAINDGTMQAAIKFSFNGKTSVATLGVDGSQSDSSDSGGKTEFTMDATITPTNDKLSVSAPAGAKPIMDVVQQLYGSSTAQTTTNDYSSSDLFDGLMTL